MTHDYNTTVHVNPNGVDKYLPKNFSSSKLEDCWIKNSEIKNSSFTEYQTDSNPRIQEINIPIEEEKSEIYIFDHGNSTYYRTTDESPVLSTEKLASKSQQAAIRFWAEIFSSIHIGVIFITAFILQFLKFLMFSTLRPLTVGVIQLTADYFIKPVLTITFNGLIQPILIFLFNVATSIRDVCKPLAEAMGYFLLEISNLCRAIRLVEIKN